MKQFIRIITRHSFLDLITEMVLIRPIPMTITWQNGRQLSGISQNGNMLASYTYNADGLRTSKTVNGITTEYYWLNGTLQGQRTGDEYILFL